MRTAIPPALRKAVLEDIVAPVPKPDANPATMIPPARVNRTACPNERPCQRVDSDRAKTLPTFITSQPKAPKTVRTPFFLAGSTLIFQRFPNTSHAGQNSNYRMLMDSTKGPRDFLASNTDMLTRFPKDKPHIAHHSPIPRFGPLNTLIPRVLPLLSSINSPNSLDLLSFLTDPQLVLRRESPRSGLKPLDLNVPTQVTCIRNFQRKIGAGS